MITFKQFLLEGGVAGHMAHPYNLPSVNTGKDLINIFNKLVKSLKTKPSVVKVDGINASLKLINNEKGEKEFALDRGSNKPEDVRGVTVGTLSSRFPAGHGMIEKGAIILKIFNTAIPSIEPDLKKLGLWDNDKILFNIEYVEGHTNVIGYNKNFLAIHGLNKIIETSSPVRKSVSRASKEIPYDKNALQNLVEAINLIAKKYGFDVEHQFTVKLGNVNLNKPLNSPFTVAFSTKNIQTKPLKDWLNSAVNTRDKKIKLLSGMSIAPLSLANYKNIVNKMPLDIYVDKKFFNEIISGAVFYHATILLGEAIKNAATSDLGPLTTQEGIVVRDASIAPNPVKITGNFILGKESGKFASKKTEEEEYGVPGQLKNISNVNNANNYQTDPPYSKAIYRGVLTPGMAL